MKMCTIRRAIVVAMAALCLLPITAHAQSAFTGTVKDTSGAVLPGVTVEASSPALIEKVRSVVTDGTGEYKIVELPPGVYAVTFALTGFSTLKREGIQLTSNFTANVSVALAGKPTLPLRYELACEPRWLKEPTATIPPTGKLNRPGPVCASPPSFKLRRESNWPKPFKSRSEPALTVTVAPALIPPF